MKIDKSENKSPGLMLECVKVRDNDNKSNVMANLTEKKTGTDKFWRIRLKALNGLDLKRFVPIEEYTVGSKPCDEELLNNLRSADFKAYYPSITIRDIPDNKKENPKSGTARGYYDFCIPGTRGLDEAALLKKTMIIKQQFGKSTYISIPVPVMWVYEAYKAEQVDREQFDVNSFIQELDTRMKARQQELMDEALNTKDLVPKDTVISVSDTVEHNVPTVEVKPENIKVPNFSAVSIKSDDFDDYEDLVDDFDGYDVLDDSSFDS